MAEAIIASAQLEVCVFDHDDKRCQDLALVEALDAAASSRSLPRW